MRPLNDFFPRRPCFTLENFEDPRDHSPSDMIVGDLARIRFFVATEIYKSTEAMCCKRSWREYFAFLKQKARDRILYSAELQHFRQYAPAGRTSGTTDLISHAIALMVNTKSNIILRRVTELETHSRVLLF